MWKKTLAIILVVHTPPYRSRSQPIERMWAWPKWGVAKRLTSGHSMASSLQQAWVDASHSDKLKEKHSELDQRVN